MLQRHLAMVAPHAATPVADDYAVTAADASASSSTVDVPYHIGRLLQAAREYGPALRMYRVSLGTAGPHPATAVGIAACADGLSDAPSSRGLATLWYRRAVAWAGGDAAAVPAATAWLRARGLALDG
jgi:hypothetical protein